MKKALMKDSVKEIKNTYKRFLSILLMAFLGVGFFAGIRATSPDMVDTIDKYYDNQNVYDIQVMSTLGLTDDDVNEISKIENVDKVIGTYEIDGKLEIDKVEEIVKVMCVEDINRPGLLEGKLPENSDECVVEPNFLTQTGKNIGDTIEIQIENIENDEGEEQERFQFSRLTQQVWDSARPDSIAFLRAVGFNAVPCDKGKDSIAYGIALMKSYRIYICRSSQEIQGEFENYCYKKNPDGSFSDDPEDANNHAIDAIRYWVMKNLRPRNIIARNSPHPPRQRNNFYEAW